MARKHSMLGIDAGHNQLKLVVTEGGYVVNAVAVPMPDNLIRDGQITSVDTLSGLIASTMKEYGIKARDAAFVMSNESVYIKNLTLPLMTIEQLRLNLPYEFSDYITGEIRDYIFDYAVLPPEEQEYSEGEEDGEASEQAETIRLMAVGVERSRIDELGLVAEKAGLRLVKAAPSVCTYTALIREQMDELKKTADEFCILDLGYESVRMYIYKEDVHEATRVLDIGLSSLDNVIADMFGVDRHLAHTYLVSNFEGCLDREECRESYDNIAVELMRAMNFYRFSNPNSHLTDMWLCGGGAGINSLCQAIGEMLDMRLHTASELVTDGDDIPNCNTFVQAVGITLD